MTTDTPRSLSGTVTVQLDTLDAFQTAVALEQRLHRLREEQETNRRARTLLEINEVSDDEKVVGLAIGQTERAIKAVEAAFGYPPEGGIEQYQRESR